MEKNIVIVESPAKAKTINKYLGNNYNVMASYGHIRDLPAKNGSVDPDNNFEMIYELNPYSKKYIDKIISESKGADSVLLATDPDREGEAIAWHVVEVLKQKKIITSKTIVKRVVFTEITKKAVTDAIKNPREIDINLVQAQQARRALDYLVGFNLSPILWRKLPGSRSAGRVQSVAVKLIADRDNDIEKFIKNEYWTISVDFSNNKNQNFTANLTHVNSKKLDKFDIKNSDEANTLSNELKEKKYAISDVEKKLITKRPSAPFITSTLQQDASRKLGFPIKKTMKIAQELYEGIKLGSETVGLITYMRTDGTQISEECVSRTRDYILKEFGKNYLPSQPIIYKSKSLNAQEAHEAIRPTDIYRHPKDMDQYLSPDQSKLYELIWKRLVSCQMESSKSELTSVDISSTDNNFKLRANGTVPIFDGYQKLYKESIDDDKEEEKKQLPALTKGEDVQANKFSPIQHFTEPPARFSEASLVKKLEELGIGRPSTYATIITVIQDREYVRLDKKRFFCEDRGRVVTSFLNSYFTQYVSYHFTAGLEDKLDLVSSGEVERNNLLSEFWNDFNKNIGDVKLKANQEVIETINDDLAHHFFPATEENHNPRTCPDCKIGKLSIKPGKFGMFVACSNYPDCKYTNKVYESKGEEGADQSNIEGGSIGTDPKSSLEVLLKKGPYGFYVQLGNDKKPKRVSIPSFIKVEDVNLEIALKLLELPRELGINPETGKEIKAGLGRYGPFILHNEKYHSLGATDNVLTVNLERALEIIAGKGVGASNAAISLGKHPETNEDISIMSGRYGPYIKHGKKNIPIPKTISSENIDLASAIELINKVK